MRLLTVLLLTTLPLISSAQSIHAEISGMIFNSGQDSVFISQYFGDHYINHVGTKFKKDGTFEFKCNLPNPDYYVLRFGENHINLIIRDKSAIKIYGDGGNIARFTNIIGSTESSNMNQYLQLESSWKHTLDSANALVASKPEVRAAVNADMTNKYKLFQGQQSSYVAQNSNSAALLPVLNTIDLNNDFASYESIVNQLYSAFKESPTVVQLHTKFQTVKEERFKNDPMAPGKPAPDFTEAYPSGDSTLSLSDLKGKVVLLDFWASWCGPCRKENPNVVKLYGKYKADGFTVLSVSLDKTKDPWLTAIEKDGLVWPYHVSDLGGWNSRVPKIYGVQGIPFTVLIDRDGNIVKTRLRGPELEAELARIFGH